MDKFHHPLIEMLMKELPHVRFRHDIDCHASGTYFMKEGVILSLNISQRGIKEFPKSIFFMKSLTFLNISNNEIAEIPHHISELTKLERLFISGNQLNNLPNEIIELINLKQLRVKKNSLSKIPPEIVKKGTESIKNYLKSLSGDFRALNELKVLMVGDGGAGKTSLLKRLTGEKFNLNEAKTHGINIRTKKIKIENSEYTINFWDFGGQEIMHSTHQFFLSKRSIYILLLDGRKEEDAEYWLKHIESFGGSSPVLILLNKVDDNPSYDVNRKFLIEKYSIIKGFYKISCRNNLGIDDFASALYKEIHNIEHISTLWPSNWFKIKIKLETMTEDFISYQKFEELCDSAKVSEESNQNLLIEFLHDLGVVLHFNDAALKETNVINPRWVTEAVYAIINSQLLADSKGLLKTSKLSRILDIGKYPKRKYDYIIELMKKFELCYSVDDDNILIPDLLDLREPFYETKDEDLLRFQINYNFLPKSIMPRFIVKSHEDIKDNMKWRTGVILEDKDLASEAIIKVDYRERNISVRVSGSNKLEYFAIIRKRFDSINSSYQKLDYAEKVPCICQLCNSKTTPFFFDYKYLLKLKNKKKYITNCQDSIEDVIIDDLLSGIEKPKNKTNMWKVFISYSSKDREIIKDLESRLNGQKVSYWLDEHEIQPGDSITTKIEYGIKNSKNVLLCLSKNQIESGWCRQEYTAILNRYISGTSKSKIIPLVLDDLNVEDIPVLIADIRSEHYSNKDGLKKLINYLAE